MKKLIPVAVCLLVALVWPLPLTHLALATPAVVTFTVLSVLDQIDDDTSDGLCHTASNTCTLRAAVMQANVTTGPSVTIMVPSGTYTLTRPPAGINSADSGDLNLASPSGSGPVISIVGAGAATTVIDANQIDRVFLVAPNRVAIISGLTVQGGFASGSNLGAGINNTGILTLDHVTVRDNQNASTAGGGLANQNTLTLIDSTIGPNNTSIEGGDIYNEFTLKALRSTIYSNHSSGDGGGIYNNAVAASLILVNSTLSQNSAKDNGGGLLNTNGSANLYNTTVVFNWADSEHQAAGSAGGLFNGTGTVNLRNTLLTGNNVGDTPVYDDCTGTLRSYGGNNLGEADQLSAPCTITTESCCWYDPSPLSLIGQLQDNGGPTLTNALLPGNKAIDSVDAGGCRDQAAVLLPTDQRGVRRALGPSCDVGAVEFMPPVAFMPLVRR